MLEYCNYLHLNMKQDRNAHNYLETLRRIDLETLYSVVKYQNK